MIAACTICRLVNADQNEGRLVRVKWCCGAGGINDYCVEPADGRGALVARGGMRWNVFYLEQHVEPVKDEQCSAAKPV